MKDYDFRTRCPACIEIPGYVRCQPDGSKTTFVLALGFHVTECDICHGESKIHNYEKVELEKINEPS